jgi:hypothetical protein
MSRKIKISINNGAVDINHFMTTLKQRKFGRIELRKFDSEEFSFEKHFRMSGFVQPFLVTGLSEKFGLKLPPRSFSVQDIANTVDRETPVRLIHVDSQTEIIKYNIGDYADYFDNPGEWVLNMISLEFSHTPLSDLVSPPKFVNIIDWVYTVWPIELISSSAFCRVQKYCLIGMAGSYTDFHIDFGGTSVWYHILWGRKRFYLIPPTVKNLLIYESWTCSSEQSITFLGDLVDDCFYFDLIPGETLIIPSGWIHAVYTPENSLVFGGNFLHTYSILHQLQSHAIEQRTHVSRAFTFPQFKLSHYYFLEVIRSHLSELLNTAPIVDEGNVLETLCRHTTLPFVVKQIPFLLKSFELWTVIDNNFSIQVNSNLIDDWWGLLDKVCDRYGYNSSIRNWIQFIKSSPEIKLFETEWLADIFNIDSKDLYLGDSIVVPFEKDHYESVSFHVPINHPIHSKKRKQICEVEEYVEDLSMQQRDNQLQTKTPRLQSENLNQRKHIVSRDQLLKKCMRR